MLEIHPVREMARLQPLYKAQELVLSEDGMAVVAMDGDKMVGYCLFSLSSEDISVKSLVPADDIALADGILRSALHVAVENGKENAFYEETAPIDVFKTLGFIKNTEKRSLDIDKLFSSCQSCSQN